MRTFTVAAMTLGLLLAAGACKSKDEAKGGGTPAGEQAQKSPEDRLCEHLGKIIDGGKYSLEECATDIGKMKADCPKWEAFVECALAAADENGAEACMEKCED